MNKIINCGIAGALAVFAAGAVVAKETPAMVSLVTPVQAPGGNYDVKGLRLSFIYGECRQFTGLDIGVANRTEGDFTGLALGGANIVGDRIYGGQLGLVNWNGNPDRAMERRTIGAQIGLVNIIARGGWMPVFPLVNGSF